MLGNLKKLWNMKVTVIPTLIGVFCTANKGLVKGLEDLEIGQVETIKTTLLRSAIILRRVLKASGDLLLPRLQWKTISERYSEKLTRSNLIKNNSWIIIIIIIIIIIVIPNVIGSLGTVTKRLIKGLEDFEVRGRVETIQVVGRP